MIRSDFKRISSGDDVFGRVANRKFLLDNESCCA